MKVKFPISKLRILLLTVGLCFAAPGQILTAATGQISGQITNATTGRPVANQPLVLLMPRGGMQPVGSFVSGPDGKFSYTSGDLSTDSFYLLQANYQGVDYNTPVKFDDRGQARLDVSVYDAAHVPSSIRIQSSRIILRAEGDKVHVQEMFAVRNESSPPRSYVNSDGTFRFHLSKISGEPTAAVTGMLEMPLPQPVIPGKGPGDYFLQYALKPGVTVVMVAYDTDYTGSKFDFADTFGFPIDGVELQVTPPSLTVASQLFQPSGTDPETGAQRLVARNVAAGAQLSASLSGEAGEAQAQSAQSMPPSGDASGMPSGGASAASSDAEVKPIPNSITRMGGLVLAGFLLVLLWGLGVRVAKEWPKWKAQQSASEMQKALATDVDNLFNSLADLDELFAGGKIQEKPYWKERLELKARLVAKLKKAPPALLESYVTRHAPR
jgi:hypothetical protein